jgi:hypothetical protein
VKYLVETVKMNIETPDGAGLPPLMLALIERNAEVSTVALRSIDVAAR